MNRYIPQEIRLLVAERAQHLCEYCLIHAEDSFVGCQVDHIISLKHGGKTELNNLAYACAPCNRAKGSDIGSMAWKTGKFTRLFNPRIDVWSEHFYLDDSLLNTLTDIGQVTARILGFNSVERILERDAMIAVGNYPSLTAHLRMKT